MRRRPRPIPGLRDAADARPEGGRARARARVVELGPDRAMLFGRTGDRNLDHPDFQPILEPAAALQASLYTHPQTQQPGVRAAYYKGLGDEIEASRPTRGPAKSSAKIGRRSPGRWWASLGPRTISGPAIPPSGNCSPALRPTPFPTMPKRPAFRLRIGCPELDGWWALHDVRSAPAGRKTMRHPLKGELHLEYASFQSNDEPALRARDLLAGWMRHRNRLQHHCLGAMLDRTMARLRT